MRNSGLCRASRIVKGLAEGRMREDSKGPFVRQRKDADRETRGVEVGVALIAHSAVVGAGQVEACQVAAQPAHRVDQAYQASRISAHANATACELYHCGACALAC